MSNIYFITGVCGIGKSSIMPYLSVLLSKEKYEIHDFDERGVPENADRAWRISESEHWVSEGIKLNQKNKATIICGFMKPTDLLDLTDKKIIEVKMILLDAEPEIIRQRLIKRYAKNNILDESQKVIGKPVNEFIESNVYFVSKMKDIFEEQDCPIIDTSDLMPEEVAKEVADIISQK